VTNRLSISGTGGPDGGVATLVIGLGGLVRTGHVTKIGPQGRLKLDGGTFSSQIIDFYSASIGTFEWTAGKLRTELFDRSLVNPAGTLAPGESIGSTTINGAYTQQSAATLEVELGGKAPGEFDRVTVNGSAKLGGTLDVRLVDLGGGVFAPMAGDTFQILTATSGILNQFEQELLPALDNLEWQVSYSPNAVSLIVTLPGDFNGDFAVDAADYVAWRKNDGSQQGYDTWRANFGRAVGAVFGSSVGAAVPEPTSCVLVLTSMLAAICCRRAVIY
jgi:hypothetical protein